MLHPLQAAVFLVRMAADTATLPSLHQAQREVQEEAAAGAASREEGAGSTTMAVTGSSTLHVHPPRDTDLLLPANLLPGYL